MNKTKSHDPISGAVHGTEKQRITTPPKSAVLGESSHLDLNQFIFNDDPICDRVFGRIVDSPPTQAHCKQPIDNTPPGSSPLSQAPYSLCDRNDKPYYPPIEPLPQAISYTHSILSTSPCYEQSVTAYPPTRMRVSNPCSPPLYRSCSVEYQPQFVSRSSQEQRCYTYPAYEGVHTDYDASSHTCMCRNNYTADHKPRYSHSPSQCGDCPYSPVATRGSLSQPTSPPVNDHIQLYCDKPSKSDQFRSIAHNSPASRQNATQPPLFPPDSCNLSHPIHSTQCAPVCVNCGHENSFAESRECDSYSPINWQVPSETCGEVVSTQESSFNDCIGDSSCSSQFTGTQCSSFSDASSQQTEQSIFDHLSTETFYLSSVSTDKQKSYRSQRRKEQRKQSTERERKRLREINLALKELGDVCCYHTHERVNTKVGTIEQAVAVINSMQTKLTGNTAAENHKKP